MNISYEAKLIFTIKEMLWKLQHYEKILNATCSGLSPQEIERIAKTILVFLEDCYDVLYKLLNGDLKYEQ